MQVSENYFRSGKVQNLPKIKTAIKNSAKYR